MSQDSNNSNYGAEQNIVRQSSNPGAVKVETCEIVGFLATGVKLIEQVVDRRD